VGKQVCSLMNLLICDSIGNTKVLRAKYHLCGSTGAWSTIYSHDNLLEHYFL